jgi:osmotically-inducible protein OsmY
MIGRLRIVRALIAPVLAAALLGLNAWSAAGQDNPPRETRGSARTSEQRLAEAVRHEVDTLPNAGAFDYIDFRVDGTRVVLLGSVVLPSLKSGAEQAVKKIPGVEIVVNKIDVLSPSAEDDALRRAEYRAIYYNSDLRKYNLKSIPPIRIIVSDRNVTLEGRVASTEEKQLAGEKARNVPNARSVRNHLEVEQ